MQRGHARHDVPLTENENFRNTLDKSNEICKNKGQKMHIGGVCLDST